MLSVSTNTNKSLSTILICVTGKRKKNKEYDNQNDWVFGLFQVILSAIHHCQTPLESKCDKQLQNGSFQAI
jgi:hypothetical protein